MSQKHAAHIHGVQLSRSSAWCTFCVSEAWCGVARKKSEVLYNICRKLRYYAQFVPDFVDEICLFGVYDSTEHDGDTHVYQCAPFYCVCLFISIGGDPCYIL